jgi:hypothetical protein
MSQKPSAGGKLGRLLPLTRGPDLATAVGGVSNVGPNRVRRGDVREASPAAAICAVILCLLWAPSRAAAFVTFLDDPGGFAAAAGAGLETLDFEDFPINPAGFGAFSNGATFGIATFDSLTFAADTDLFAGGVDTGLDGTFLVGLRQGGLDVRPGGAGAIGTPEDDDDFGIGFDPPVRAVSLVILNNSGEDGEAITVFSDGTPIASVPLPGGGNGSVRFWGIVLDPGEDPITSLEVLEGLEIGVGTGANDDIAFDNVAYVHDGCVPFVTAIRGARDVTLRNSSTGGNGSTTTKRLTVSATLPSTGAGGDCPDGSTRQVAINVVATDDAGNPFFQETATTDSKGNLLTVTAGARKGAQAKFRVPLTPDECGSIPDPAKPEILLGEIDYSATAATRLRASSLTETVGITCKP